MPQKLDSFTVWPFQGETKSAGHHAREQLLWQKHCCREVAQLTNLLNNKKNLFIMELLTLQAREASSAICEWNLQPSLCRKSVVILSRCVVRLQCREDVMKKSIICWGHWFQFQWLTMTPVTLCCSSNLGLLLLFFYCWLFLETLNASWMDELSLQKEIHLLCRLMYLAYCLAFFFFFF